MCFSCELPEIGRHIYHHQLPLLLLLLLLLLMMMLPTSACRLLLLLLAVIIIAGTAHKLSSSWLDPCASSIPNGPKVESLSKVTFN